MALPPSGPQIALTMLQERSSGTFARVYLAEARGSDGLTRIVAVKVLKEQWLQSDDLMDRTRDEAMLLARLRHKNILRVESMTQLNGQPAIVMEFVDGVDLRQLIESKDGALTAFPPRAAYRVAMDSASALHAAWSRVPYGQREALRVVHRDIKPPNIMISVEGEVKVLDFGTARFTHDLRAAQTGQMRFGSMKYMSPERRNGARGEHSCDVYALGLVLIEMLQGEILPLLPIDPHEHDDALTEIVADMDNLGLPDAEWEASLRQALCCICASDPDKRLTAEQVVDLMRAFRDNAQGESLDSFANRRVRAVTQAIFGESDSGEFTGSQVIIRAHEIPTPAEEPPSAHEASAAPLTPPDPPPSEWTDKAASAVPAASSPVDQRDLDTEDLAPPRSSVKSGKHPIVLMTMVLLPVFLLAFISVVYMAKQWHDSDKKPRSSRDRDREKKEDVEDPAGTNPVAIQITMNPGEEEIRYVHLDEFESGTPLIHIRPESDSDPMPLTLEGEVPSVRLRLSIKLRFGDELVTALTPEDSLALVCGPSMEADERQIICVETGGENSYTLERMP